MIYEAQWKMQSWQTGVCQMCRVETKVVVMLLNNQQKSVRIRCHSEDDLSSVKCQPFIISTFHKFVWHVHTITAVTLELWL